MQPSWSGAPAPSRQHAGCEPTRVAWVPHPTRRSATASPQPVQGIASPASRVRNLAAILREVATRWRPVGTRFLDVVRGSEGASLCFFGLAGADYQLSG